MRLLNVFDFDEDELSVQLLSLIRDLIVSDCHVITLAPLMM